MALLDTCELNGGTNAKFQSTRGFLVQDAKDLVFQNTQFEIAIGDPLVLDNGSVK